MRDSVGHGRRPTRFRDSTPYPLRHDHAYAYPSLSPFRDRLPSHRPERSFAIAVGSSTVKTTARNPSFVLICKIMPLLNLHNCVALLFSHYRAVVGAARRPFAVHLPRL